MGSHAPRLELTTSLLRDWSIFPAQGLAGFVSGAEIVLISFFLAFGSNFRVRVNFFNRL